MDFLPKQGPVDDGSLKPSVVDRSASFLMTSLVLMVACVTLLGILFFMNQGSPTIEAAPMGGGTIGSTGFIEIHSEYDEPTLSEVSVDQTFTPDNAIQLVNLVSSDITQASEWESHQRSSFRGDGTENGPGTGNGEGNGNGNGKGDGDGDGDGKALPRAERWELRFSARDLRSYGQQLASVGLELGAYGAGIPKVEYATKLDQSMPVRREGLPNDEVRLYFVSMRDGALVRYDKELLKRSGIVLAGRTPMKFVSKETENRLVAMESEYGQKKLGSKFATDLVAKTVFECRPKVMGQGFEFVVLEQRYRIAR
jgi:hypothetical protein